MREKLELKILTLVLVLLLLGVLAAGFMVQAIEKRSLYSITESSLESTADIVAQDIQRSMLAGKADLVKSMVQEVKGLKGIEELSIIHYDGHHAFTSDSTTTESPVMNEITKTKAPIVVRDDRKITFYRPLINEERCRACHVTDPAVLGAVKLSLSIEKEYNRVTRTVIAGIGATITASILFSLVLWFMIRKMVIKPIKGMEKAAHEMSQGDLSFDIDIRSSDEIGRFSSSIKDSMLSISNILRRIKDVSKRITYVAEEVETESGKVIEGAVRENEAFGNISTSIEEMNAAISEIDEGTEGLAASAEETAASMDQMVTSIAQINGSTQDLSVAVESTSASIEQLSATIREVASNSTELAVAAEETQSSIMEIASSVKEVEQRAKESSILSGKVKNDATTFGMTSIGKAVDGMKEIKVSVEKTAGCIKKLGGRSEEIGKILNVIDEITDQTTLLALNAAILAAQAGEHGKGFSVVADEIKNLAERTSVSTQEIGTLIQSVQQEVADAVEAMEDGLKSVHIGFKVTAEVAEALRKIVESSKQSSDMSDAIERSTAEQAKATKLVSEAMEKVLRRVGEIAKATTEQSRGIQLIMKATEKIRDVSNHVRTATNEQSLNSKQVSQAIELVSDKSQQISRAIHEQKIGSNQIWSSLEKIKDIPRENKERSFRLNQSVRKLVKDAELASAEMEHFIFVEDTSTVLRLGVMPMGSPAVVFRKLSPLAEYLSKKMDRRIDLKVAVDPQGAIKDVGEGVTQLCFMTPSTYIEAHIKYGVSVLLKAALKDGKIFQHSVIIAGGNSSINEIKDLKGHSFAFGDIYSTSSHIVPRAMLLAEGIDVKDLQYYNYLGHHDDIAKAVMNGDFDAGAVMESTAYKYKDRGIKFVKISDDIPEFNICVSKNIDAKLKNELKNAFFSLNSDTPEGATVLKSISENYTGFVNSSDAEYEGIRKMMSTLGLI